MPSTSSPALRPLVLRRIVTGVVLLAASFGLGLWIEERGDIPFPIDQWWNSYLVGTSTPVLGGFAQVLDRVGGGWVAVLLVPILGAIGLLVLRRPWAALFFVTASALSAGWVQVVKSLFGRARPEEILVISDYGSYPSGHTANAATIAAVAVILFPRLWVGLVAAAWVVLMALSRTIVHAHWLSDTVGGALAGVAVALLVGGAFAPLLARDRGARAASVKPQEAGDTAA